MPEIEELEHIVCVKEVSFFEYNGNYKQLKAR